MRDRNTLSERITSNLINIGSKGWVRNEGDFNSALNTSVDILELFYAIVNESARCDVDVTTIIKDVADDLDNLTYEIFDKRIKEYLKNNKEL